MAVKLSAASRTSHSPCPGWYRQGGGPRVTTGPRLAVPAGGVPSKPALPGSVTRQYSAPAAVQTRSLPRPPPYRTALAASSCATSTTSGARLSGMPAAIAQASTALRSMWSVPALNSCSSTAASASLPRPAARSSRDGCDRRSSGRLRDTGVRRLVDARRIATRLPEPAGLNHSR